MLDGIPLQDFFPPNDGEDGLTVTPLSEETRVVDGVSLATINAVKEVWLDGRLTLDGVHLE